MKRRFVPPVLLLFWPRVGRCSAPNLTDGNREIGGLSGAFRIPVMGANFLPLPNESAETLRQKALWREHLWRALKTVTPEIAGDLLGDEDRRAIMRCLVLRGWGTMWRQIKSR